jgi:SAM-dependent methyltransferase
MQDHWERHATDWIRWARTPGHDIWYWRLNRPWFLELLPPPGRLTVDLGCGEGRLLRELAAMGHRVVGVDRAPTMARAAAQAVGSDAGVVVADAARLPLAGGAADLVVAFMSLLNVDDLPAAVGEAGRVLATGGRLCVALLHPIASAGTFLQDDADARFVLTRSYFEPGCEPQVFERGGLSMTFLDRHLPLEAYFGALQAAGLVVEALREPRPDDAAVSDHPAMGRRRRVPLLLHLRAVKPTTGSSGPA